MKDDMWNYQLHLISQSYSSGVDMKMNVKHLKEAFFLLVDQSLSSFLPQKEWSQEPSLKEAIIFDANGKVKLKAQIGENVHGNEGNIIEGLYYEFPSGIRNFERESGISLKLFKEYNSKLDYILVAYLLRNPEVELKKSTGYRLMKDTANSYLFNSMRYSVHFEHSVFGSETIQHREINPKRSAESFHYNKAEDAFLKMISIDFKRVDEDISWDNDWKYFYSKIEMCERSESDSYIPRANLFSTKSTYILPYGHVEDMGVYLSNEPCKDFPIDLSSLKRPFYSSSMMLLAKYNPLETEVEKVKELDIIINKYQNTARQKPIRKKISSPRNVLPDKKGKGRKL